MSQTVHSNQQNFSNRKACPRLLANDFHKCGPCPVNVFGLSELCGSLSQHHGGATKLREFPGLVQIGACATTTKYLDNKMFTFKIILSWRFPRETAFLDNFPLCPNAPPPPKIANFNCYVFFRPFALFVLFCAHLGVSGTFCVRRDLPLGSDHRHDTTLHLSRKPSP